MNNRYSKDDYLYYNCPFIHLFNINGQILTYDI